MLYLIKKLMQTGNNKQINNSFNVILSLILRGLHFLIV